MLKLPTYPAPSLSSKLYFYRLPNALHLEHKQFNKYNILPFIFLFLKSETFRSEYLDLDDEARMQSIHHDSVIRWRKGEQKRESNSRVVRWSDGSMQLFVGNEIFDITQQDMINSDNVHLFLKVNL